VANKVTTLINAFVDVLPSVIGVAVIAGFVMLAGWRYLPPRTGAATQGMVTLDVVKLANAERALASKLWQKNAVDLTSISGRTRQVIQQYADGRLVLIKQATVGANLPDITDQVLVALGLPTKVPTQLPSDYVLNPAPTNTQPIHGPSLLQTQSYDPSKGMVP
jgi:hypothetical protein